MLQRRTPDPWPFRGFNGELGATPPMGMPAGSNTWYLTVYPHPPAPFCHTGCIKYRKIQGIGGRLSCVQFSSAASVLISSHGTRTSGTLKRDETAEGTSLTRPRRLADPVKPRLAQSTSRLHPDRVASIDSRQSCRRCHAVDHKVHSALARATAVSCRAQPRQTTTHMCTLFD